MIVFVNKLPMVGRKDTFTNRLSVNQTTASESEFWGVAYAQNNKQRSPHIKDYTLIPLGFTKVHDLLILFISINSAPMIIKVPEYNQIKIF